MKKSIALLALVGAFGAAANAISLDDAVIGFADFNGGEGAITGTEAANLTLSATEEAIQLQLTGATFSTVTNSRTNMTITLVLDASKITLPESGAVSIIKDNGSGWGLGINASGILTGTWSTNNSYYATTADLSDGGRYTITIATGFINGSADGTRIYDDAGATYWRHTGLKGSFNSSTLTINADFADAIEKLYVFSTALQASEVAAVVPEIEAVPEPATATLSLLALAGLAARRRRK